MLGLKPRSYVLFVGTVEPRKGIDVLLAAHAALRRQGHPDLRLVVAGPPGWGATPPLDGEGVVAPGRIDEATLDALYRGAAALAVPSLSEGFGLPALEAMARGCPVVASKAGALPEVVGDAGVLVPPGDPDSLAAALDGILSDERRRRLAGGRRPPPGRHLHLVRLHRRPRRRLRGRPRPTCPLDRAAGPGTPPRLGPGAPPARRLRCSQPAGRGRGLHLPAGGGAR